MEKNYEKEESKVYRMFGKKVKDLTSKEFQIYVNNKEKNDYKNTLAYQITGKRFVECNKDEVNEYCRKLYKARYKEYYKNYYQNKIGEKYLSFDKKFCFNHFGKREKDLSPEERRIFWAIRKKISRIYLVTQRVFDNNVIEVFETNNKIFKNKNSDTFFIDKLPEGEDINCYNNIRKHAILYMLKVDDKFVFYDANKKEKFSLLNLEPIFKYENVFSKIIFK